MIQQYDLTNKYQSYFSANQNTHMNIEYVSEDKKRKTSYLTSTINPNSTQAYIPIEVYSGLIPGHKTHIRELLEEPGLPDDLQIEQENNTSVGQNFVRTLWTDGPTGHLFFLSGHDEQICPDTCPVIF